MLLCIFPFLVITIFDHPFYDDYSYAAKALEYGLLGVQRFWYVSWSGRYSSNMLLSLHPLVFGSFYGYKAIASILILLIFISIYFLVSALLKEASAIDKLIATSFLAALFSNQMPELTEGYYWMPGSLSYMLAGVLILFFFGLLIKISEGSGSKRRLWFLLSCLLVIVIVGLSETGMLILLFLMLSITVKSFINSHGSKWLWLSLLMLATLCTLVVILAPGNAVRNSYFTGQNHRLLYSLLISAAQEARFLLKWFSNPALILGTILFIPFAARLSERCEPFKSRFNLHPAIGLLLLLGTVYLGFFPAYWSTGLLGQHRSVNLVFFLFLIGWFVNLAMWVSYLKRKLNWQVASLPAYVYAICLLLIPLTLLTTNNTREVIEDLASARAYRYDMQMKQRYSQIEQCLKAGQAVCQIETLRDVPTSLTSAYIDKDLSHDEGYGKIRLTQEPAK